MSKLSEMGQIPLEFSTPTYMGRDDFMVSDCNRQAFEMINSWPNWLGNGLIIYGPSGCGKSHLAHLFAEKVTAEYPKTIRVPIVDACNVTLSKAKKLYLESPCLIVENIEAARDEEALFHLFNMYNTSGFYILWTAACAPHYIHFKLKDLQSRFDMLSCAEIKEPDDFMLQMLIVKQCNDRQLAITPDILKYIITNSQRSFAHIRELVKELDYLSLSWHKPVSYNMVKTAIKNLDARKNIQPNFFDDN